jgi:hypothetical protein
MEGTGINKMGTNFVSRVFLHLLLKEPQKKNKEESGQNEKKLE